MRKFPLGYGNWYQLSPLIQAVWGSHSRQEASLDEVVFAQCVPSKSISQILWFFKATYDHKTSDQIYLELNSC